MEINGLVDDLITGYRIRREDRDVTDYLKACDLDTLLAGADRLRAEYKGNYVDLCSIIAGKSGNCGENCRFCAQSAHNHTQCDVYELLDYASIYKEAASNESQGVHRFAIVNSGRRPSEEDFDRLILIFERLTTSGSTIKNDIDMLTRMGRTVIRGIH